MSRTFHLSCSGCLNLVHQDPRQLASALASAISDPRIIDAILSATPRAPCRVTASQSTLAKTKALDAALLRLGFLSQILFIDSKYPDSAQIYINERVNNPNSDRRHFLDNKPIEAGPLPAKPSVADPTLSPRKPHGRRESDGPQA